MYRVAPRSVSQLLNRVDISRQFDLPEDYYIYVDTGRSSQHYGLLRPIYRVIINPDYQSKEQQMAEEKYEKVKCDPHWRKTALENLERIQLRDENELRSRLKK